MCAPSLTRPRGVTPVCTYSLSHLSNGTLLRELKALVAQELTTTAAVLAHLAEVDARQLYLPAGYPSMFLYCVQELHLSEDAAFKRIKAARAGRRCPAVFTALAQGRVHLSAVVLLAPHLSEETAGALLAAATHRTKAEIEQLLAERFPRPDVLAWMAPIASSSHAGSPVEQAPGPAGSLDAEPQQAPGPVPTPPVSGPVCDRPRVQPLSAQSFAVQFTLSRRAHEKLRYAQELLGHQIPSGDIAQVFERALDALIPRLEKQKFAATRGPRRPRCHSRTNPRYIPAEVKRAVWTRDQGRCTFVSDAGQRCPARRRLEFDHAQEVARGGEASVSGIRLRCREHNQYSAERAFGAEFMRRKRHEARSARGHMRERATTIESTPARTAAEAQRAQEQIPMKHARERDAERDVIPWLRALGFRADEARRAAVACEVLHDTSLEERVRLALSFLRPPHRSLAPSPQAGT
jgi:hypothetical protein